MCTKMTFGFCAFGTKWVKRTAVLAGHVDFADVWALDTMRFVGTNGAVLLVKNTCNSSAMILFINARAHTETESIR